MTPQPPYPSRKSDRKSDPGARQEAHQLGLPVLPVRAADEAPPGYFAAFPGRMAELLPPKRQRLVRVPWGWLVAPLMAIGVFLVVQVRPPQPAAPQVSQLSDESLWAWAEQSLLDLDTYSLEEALVASSVELPNWEFAAAAVDTPPSPRAGLFYGGNEGQSQPTLLNAPSTTASPEPGVPEASVPTSLDSIRNEIRELLNDPGFNAEDYQNLLLQDPSLVF